MRCTIGPRLFEAFARQLQHALTRVQAIYFNGRMHTDQLAKKSSIPLAYDERAARPGNFSETRNSAALELAAEGDPFQRPIPRRDRVKAHALAPISTTSGVTRTRSARAVR